MLGWVFFFGWLFLGRVSRYMMIQVKNENDTQVTMNTNLINSYLFQVYLHLFWFVWVFFSIPHELISLKSHLTAAKIIEIRS